MTVLGQCFGEVLQYSDSVLARFDKIPGTSGGFNEESVTYWRGDNHALTVLESTGVVNWGYAQHALVRHWRRTGETLETHW